MHAALEARRSGPCRAAWPRTSRRRRRGSARRRASTPGGWWRCPTLAPTLTASPPAGTRWANAAMMRSATTTTSSGPSRRSSRTANSSPPKRAMVSDGRTHSHSRSATAISSSSPTAWPSVSLTVLKSSRSTNSTATEGSGSRERLLDPVDEQRAVGQVGERVVEGLVLELALELAQLQTVCSRRSYWSATRGVGGERLEQLQVVVGEVADDAEAVGQHHRADDARLARQHREHRVGDAAAPRDSGAGARLPEAGVTRTHGLVVVDERAQLVGDRRVHRLHHLARVAGAERGAQRRRCPRRGTARSRRSRRGRPRPSARAAPRARRRSRASARACGSSRRGTRGARGAGARWRRRGRRGRR